MRQLDNPLKIRNTRRDIARLETLIQREQSKSKGGTA
jgi:ribosomal protein L29